MTLLYVSWDRDRKVHELKAEVANGDSVSPRDSGDPPGQPGDAVLRRCLGRGPRPVRAGHSRGCAVVSGFDAGTLPRLADLRAPDAKVLSLYLDLDPSLPPAGRQTQIQSLLLEAENRYLKGADGLSHHAKVALREDLERVRAFLDTGEYSSMGARAIAIFCSGPAGLFEVLELARPMRSEVVVDDAPFVEPLTQAVSPEGWCVLLVNRRTARIFRGSRERLEEISTLRDDVHGWHDQGGWSQARYQRGIEKEVHDHLKRTCEELFDLHKRRPFRGVIVGTLKELWPEVEAALHPYLRDLVVGRIDVDIEHSTASDVQREAAQVIEEEEHRAERAAVDRLREGLGTGQKAVAGLGPVLDALNQRRVETLLIEAGFRAPGAVCACGWTGPSAETCPIDGGSMEPREDIVENAVALAFGQSAEVQVIQQHDDLGELGSIAAICRF
jgi:peptide chain release factor subunit 1